LVAGVVAVSGLLGTSLAWLVTFCEFLGRQFFNWALLLPLAIPPYVLGMVIVGCFASDSALHTLWLALLGEAETVPDLRSRGWLIVSMGLSFYPYVYLPARYAFQYRSKQAMELARSLEAKPYRAFLRAGLPTALPWIGVGLVLVAAHTLADIGTVSVFGYETFATALYQAWLAGYSLPEAVCWAFLLLVLAFLGQVYEQRQRRLQDRYPPPLYDQKLTPSPELNTPPNYLVLLCMGGLLMVVFLFPFSQLLLWSLAAVEEQMVYRLMHSLLISAAGAVLVVCMALVLGLAKRHYPAAKWPMRIATLGDVLPGAVLALGILAAVTSENNPLNRFMQSLLDLNIASSLGGLCLLLLAYFIRFLGLGFGLADATLRGASPDLVDSARSLGIHGLPLWRQVYWPLLGCGLLGTYLLVFAAIARELPIMLLLRPADWDTLPVGIFEAALAGQWHQAALPSLLLVLAGLPQVFLLAHHSERKHGHV
jgi:iron(III) transport system permease protein